MLEVAAKTASRYFFPKIARYRFCIRGLGVYELCLYPIKAFFDCEAPPGDVFRKIDKVFLYMRAARHRRLLLLWRPLGCHRFRWGRTVKVGRSLQTAPLALDCPSNPAALTVCAQRNTIPTSEDAMGTTPVRSSKRVSDHHVSFIYANGYFMDFRL